MGKDRKVQPEGRETEDALRPFAGYALFGVVAAMGVGGVWHLWELVVDSGVPFWSGFRAFLAVLICLVANGFLAWIMTKSWEKDLEFHPEEVRDT